ncbi:MAG: hypothetical protein ABI333_22440 [bacterium]
MRKTPHLSARLPSGRRALTAWAGMCAFGLGLAIAGAACVSESGTGTGRVSYLLLDPEGEPLTCERAGVSELSLRLYVERGDPEPAHELGVACEVDDEGAGRAEVELEVGFYASSLVSLRDDVGQVVELLSGARAEWEFLAVDITSAGVTDYLPVIEATFSATAL